MQDHPFVKAVAWSADPIREAGKYIVVHEGRVIWQSDTIITLDSAADIATENSKAVRDANPGSHLYVRVKGT